MLGGLFNGVGSKAPVHLRHLTEETHVLCQRVFLQERLGKVVLDVVLVVTADQGGQ